MAGPKKAKLGEKQPSTLERYASKSQKLADVFAKTIFLEEAPEAERKIDFTSMDSGVEGVTPEVQDFFPESSPADATNYGRTIEHKVKGGTARLTKPDKKIDPRSKFGTSTRLRNQALLEIQTNSGEEYRVRMGGKPGFLGEKGKPHSNEMGVAQMRSFNAQKKKGAIALYSFDGADRVNGYVKAAGLESTINVIKYNVDCHGDLSRNEGMMKKIAKEIKSGNKEVIGQCQYGSHRTRYMFAGAMLYAGLATSVSHAMQLVDMDINDFKTIEYTKGGVKKSKSRAHMLAHLVKIAKSQGLPVGSQKINTHLNKQRKLPLSGTVCDHPEDWR